MTIEPTIPRDEHFKLTARIVNAALAVHAALGPGFLEQIYHRALIVQLNAENLALGVEAQVPVHHLGVVVGRHEIDLLVDGRAIVELKAVNRLDARHFAQVRSYLAATNLDIGLLFNFGGYRLETRRIFSPRDRRTDLLARASRAPRVPAQVGRPDSAPASDPRD